MEINFCRRHSRLGNTYCLACRISQEEEMRRKMEHDKFWEQVMDETTEDVSEEALDEKSSQQEYLVQDYEEPEDYGFEPILSFQIPPETLNNKAYLLEPKSFWWYYYNICDEGAIHMNIKSKGG